MEVSRVYNAGDWASRRAATANCLYSDRLNQLQFDRVVRGVYQILLCAQIPFGGLNRGVAQQHLDLLQFAARSPTQLRAGAPQVVRRNIGNVNLGGVLLKHLPDDLLTQAVACNAATAVHGPENMAVGSILRRGPRVDCHLHPRWHWRGSNASVFPNQIDNAPAPIALLEVCEREGRHFRSPQPTAEKHG